jgi:hypothetical protein
MAWGIFHFRSPPPESRTYRRIEGKKLVVRVDERVLSALENTVRAAPGREIGGLLIGVLGEEIQIDDAQTGLIDRSDARRELCWNDIKQLSGKQKPLIGHFRCHRKGVPEPKAEDHVVADMLRVGAPVLVLLPGLGQDAILYRRMQRVWSEELRFPLLRQPASGRTPNNAAGVTSPGPVLVQPPTSISSSSSGHTWRRPLGWIGIGILVTAALIGSLTWRRQSLRDRVSVSPALDLRIERHDPGLFVRWNASSPEVMQGTSGILSIQAAGQQLQVPLDRQSLRGGNVFYVPISPRVEFRLDIYRGPNEYSGETISVSTGLRLPVPPPTPEQSPVPAQTAQIGSPEQTNLAPKSEQPPNRPQPLRRFEQRTMGAALPVSRSIVSPLPTPPQIAAPPQQVGLPDLLAPGATPPVTPAAPSVIYVAAVPIRKIQPAVPPSLHSMIPAALSIEVKVEIDTEGRVVSAAPVDVVTPAQKLLAPEAAQAARLWRFEPARRNQEPVPSEARLKFDFERQAH